MKLVHQFAGKLRYAVDTGALLAAGESLDLWTETLRHHGRKIPDNVCGTLYDAARTHVEMCLKCGIDLKPKHHLFLHLSEQIKCRGNPRFYHTYRDEGLNRTIKKIAISSHRSTLERRLFAKFRLAHAESVNDDWF